MRPPISGDLFARETYIYNETTQKKKEIVITIMRVLKYMANNIEIICIYSVYIKKLFFLQILFFLFGLFNNSCSYLMKNDKLTLAPKNLASSSSCLRGSRAGWN